MTDVPQPEWRPLDVRNSGEPSEFDVLHEGIQPWMHGTIWRWLMDRAAEGGSSLINRLELRLHVPLTTDRDRPLGKRHTAPNALLERYWNTADDEKRLRLLDAILVDLQRRSDDLWEYGHGDVAEELEAAAERLDEYLVDGGSVWSAHVDKPYWGLVRRVNDTTTALVTTVTTPDTDAARKIRSAWHACYRHDPNHDAAYRDAVLAVEAVAIPLALPDATRATLGTVIAHIRDTVDRWSVGGLDAEQIASGQTLLSMLQTLWHNQQRHARPDGTIYDVSREEAEAAVALAVTLVHWFTSGLVKRDDSRS